LDSAGKPIQSQKGKTFKAFVASIRSLGYRVDWRILCAADYGDPTTRKRLFIQGVKGRKRILWPQITHMDGDANLMGCLPWRPARDIIDWSIPGTSIFNRKKPLSDNTIRRIAAGIEKYWKDSAEPFLSILYGASKTSTLDMPLPTITGSGAHHAIVEPFFIDYYGNGSSSPVNVPLRTITTRDRFALLDPFIFNLGHSSARDRAQPIDMPLSTIVTKAEHCLIEPARNLDIRFRMLKNNELKKAHSFPDDYILKGNITEQTRQIGNSVPVKLARSLAMLVMN
jgi:DNA (cytosine-5)-methyltransferase 1